MRRDGAALCRGIRERYPEWRHLVDGDGGDENLKDYPIEENPELTIRSVVDNLMLYQEGWGVGRIKHSLTYSGGLSRSYVRTYAPARRYGFEGFSPYTRPASSRWPKAFPSRRSQYNVPTLYALKGEIVARGMKAVTGLDMPVVPEAALPARRDARRGDAARIGGGEITYRQTLDRLYSPGNREQGTGNRGTGNWERGLALDRHPATSLTEDHDERSTQSIRPSNRISASASFLPSTMVDTPARAPLDVAFSRLLGCSSTYWCYIRGMTKEVTLRQAGGSVSATLPKDMADRFRLEAGDRILAVETDRGILLTPYDPDVERALTVAATAAKKYRNALRKLAK